MSFKEFVVENGRADLIDTFKEWPMDRKIPKLYSAPMEELLKTYYIVGGIPEVVKTWTLTHDYNKVEKLQKEILYDIEKGFSKVASLSDTKKIQWVWDSVPTQLHRKNNKFLFSHVKEGMRSAELENALQWLIDAGLIIKVNLVEKPEVPLVGASDKTYFKAYVPDVGLLRTKSKVPVDAILAGFKPYIRDNRALTENYILNELKSLGKTPFFWRSGNTAEVDFIYENRGQILPVEVKSADNAQAKSYKQFCKKYNPKKGLKISQKNIEKNLCESTTTYSIPLYLTWNIKNFIKT